MIVCIPIGYYRNPNLILIIKSKNIQYDIHITCKQVKCMHKYKNSIRVVYTQYGGNLTFPWIYSLPRLVVT